MGEPPLKSSLTPPNKEMSTLTTSWIETALANKAKPTGHARAKDWWPAAQHKLTPATPAPQVAQELGGVSASKQLRLLFENWTGCCKIGP